MSILSTMLVASTAAGLICSGGAQTNMDTLQTQVNNNKNIIIKQGNISNSADIKAFLENNGINAKDFDNCLRPSLPENCLPGIGNPGTGNPGTGNPGTDNPGTDNPGGGDITDSSYASQVVNLVNAERSNRGLKPLSIDKNAAAAAGVRAKEIKQSFSHTRPDGSHFSTVLKDNGVSYRTSGENIAWGQRTPEEVVKGWMNSEGHRANILNEKFTSIGVGYYENGGTAYWAQLFIG